MRLGKKGKIWLIVGSLVLATVLAVTAVFGVRAYKEKRKYEEAVQMIKQYYDDKVSAFIEENKSVTPGETDVVFLGDSLTDGYDLEKYYPQYRTLNRGIGGDTTHGLYARLQVSVYEAQPKAVVVLIGGNNMDSMFEDYETIVSDLRTNLPNSKIVLLSLTAMGGDWAYKNLNASYNNAKIKIIAQEYGCAFVDLFSALLDPQTDEINSSYTSDGVHFTAEGYAVLTQKITPVLQEIIE